MGCLRESLSLCFSTLPMQIPKRNVSRRRRENAGLWTAREKNAKGPYLAQVMSVEREGGINPKSNCVSTVLVHIPLVELL